jgi:hypothetical protein
VNLTTGALAIVMLSMVAVAELITAPSSASGLSGLLDLSRLSRPLRRRFRCCSRLAQMLQRQETK